MALHTYVLLVGAVAALTAQSLYPVIYNLFFSPLKQFPGPFLGRVTRIPYSYHFLRGQSHVYLQQLHDKFGPVVRYAPTELSCAKSEAWKDVWAHRQGHGEFFKNIAAAPVNGVQGILGANRQDHSRFRRLLSHAFSAQGLREQEHRIQYYVDLFMSQLSAHCTSGSVDVVAWFNWTTFDLIGDLTFGESFGCLENAQTHPWVKAIFNSLAASSFFYTARIHNLTWLLSLITPRRFAEGRLKNYQLSSDKIDRRVRHGGDRGDFLDNVLKHDLIPSNTDPEKAAAAAQQDKGMTILELKSNASNLVLAGSETTATLLSGTTYLLVTNHATLDKLVNEIRTSFSSDREITIDSTSHLSYLLAVLNEAMRVYPPVPTFAGRRVPAGGDTVDGVFLPAGTSVNIPQIVAFTSERYFHDARSFRPERWLEGSEKPVEFKNDDPSVFQPFSVGPRNCIGKNLAYAEMRLILAKFLWRFDIKKPDEGTAQRKTFDEWRASQRTYFLWEKGPLPLVVQERVEVKAERENPSVRRPVEAT